MRTPPGWWLLQHSRTIAERAFVGGDYSPHGPTAQTRTSACRCGRQKSPEARRCQRCANTKNGRMALAAR